MQRKDGDKPEDKTTSQEQEGEQPYILTDEEMQLFMASLNDVNANLLTDSTDAEIPPTEGGVDNIEETPIEFVSIPEAANVREIEPEPLPTNQILLKKPSLTPTEKALYQEMIARKQADLTLEIGGQIKSKREQKEDIKRTEKAYRKANRAQASLLEKQKRQQALDQINKQVVRKPASPTADDKFTKEDWVLLNSLKARKHEEEAAKVVKRVLSEFSLTKSSSTTSSTPETQGVSEDSIAKKHKKN